MKEGIYMSRFGWKPELKRSLERPRYKCTENIKMNLIEIVWDDKDWIHLAQDGDKWRALLKKAMNIRVP
jgi:hypothetical protein